MRTGSWGSIGLIYVYVTLAGAAIGKVVPIVPDMARATGSSLDSAAWFISIIVAASVVLAPFAGELVDRIGDRKMILIGVLISMAGCAGGAVLSGFYPLVAARGVEGVGYMVLALGTAAMTTRTVQGTRLQVAMALAAAAVPFGSGTAMVLAGLVAGGRGNWHNVFWVSGAVWAVVLLGVPFLPAWSKPKASGHVNASWVNVMMKPAPLRLAVGLCVATVVLFGLGTLLPLFMERNYGMTPLAANALGIIGFPAPVIGSLMVGAVLSRYRNIRNLIWLCVGVMAVTGAICFLPGLGVPVTMAIFVVFYLFGGMLSGISMSRLPSVVPSPAAMGVTTGLVMQGANLGVLLGPPAMYFCFNHQGNYGVIGLVLASLALTWWLWGLQPKIAATVG